jgi:hypothetical protein
VIRGIANNHGSHRDKLGGEAGPQGSSNFTLQLQCFALERTISWTAPHSLECGHASPLSFPSLSWLTWLVLHERETRKTAPLPVKEMKAAMHPRTPKENAKHAESGA